MYILIVVMTMFALPVASVFVEHGMAPGEPLMGLVGRWFVFWGIGVRLGLAGLRQIVQPKFTAQQIFHMQSEEALPLVRELGVANAATGLVGLLSLGSASFLLPIAISAGVFYGVAGATHMAQRDRSLNENIAMVSDLFIFAVLATYVFASLPHR